MRIAPLAPSVDLIPQQRSVSTTIQPTSRPVHARTRAKSVQHALSPRVHRWVWIALLGFHALNAAVMAGIARLYFYISAPDAAYKYESLQVSLASLQRSGTSFALIACAHGLVILRILFYSLRHKQLVFCKPVDRRPSRVDAEYPSQYMAVRALCSLWSGLWSVWYALFGQNGYFGLNGSLFDSGFEAREAIEISLQTYQAYNLSRSVPRPWINSLAVVVIALSCCVTPLAHAIFRGESKTLMRRLFCRVADVLLDSCCSLVIPICVFYPYWQRYDPGTGDFRTGGYFDEVWYVNAVAEGRYILITSVSDFISTLVPHVSILSCLLTIESLLQKRSCVGGQSATNLACTVEQRIATDQNWAKLHRKTQRVRFMVHSAFVVWGVSVAVVHLYAQMNGWQTRLGCKLHTDAWFTTNYSCSVMEVNCYHHQVSGDSGQISSILDDLDRLVLRSLIISHCPALSMPPVVQEFSQLGGVEIYNCSVVEWGPNAAMREEFHSKLAVVYILSSNLSGVPDALLHRDLPVGLSRINFYQTNLSTIPEDIDTHWGDKEWTYLGFAGCNISSIPPAMGKLSLLLLALQENRIEFIPKALVENPHLRVLTLSKNPLRALPDAIGASSDRVFEVAASNTNISSIPKWLREWVNLKKISSSSLLNTPFCDSLLEKAGAAAADINNSPQEGDLLDSDIVSQLCVAREPSALTLDALLPLRQP